MKHLFPIVSLCGAIVLAGCGSSSSSPSGSDDPSGDTPTNVAPTIAGDANTTVSVGQPYSFIPTAGDADGDVLTFSIQNKPAWADFNASNGALTGTPTAYGATADINISVSDGEDTASLPLFTLTVYERVKATGQLKSYDANGTEVTDGSVKDDGYYLAGSALDYTRTPLDADEINATVTDNVTGMMWQDDTDVTVKTSLKNADGDLDYDAVCAARNAGGYSDWRFPTIHEVVMFSDFGTSDYNPKVLENIPASFVRTSSYLNGSTIFMWSLSPSVHKLGKTFFASSGYVRCVRGDELDTTATLERDHETGTVTDVKTGLMWQDDSNITDAGTMDWAAAIDRCEAMSLGGYDDWRLPNLMEMVSITDFDNETIKTGFETAGGTDYFWTSTSRVDAPSFAWAYRFDPNGSDFADSNTYSKTQGAFKTMCVRTIE